MPTPQIPSTIPPPLPCHPHERLDSHRRAKTDDAADAEEAEAAPVDKGKGKSTAPAEEPEAEEEDEDESDDELIVRGPRRRKQVDYSSVSLQQRERWTIR